MKRFILNLFKTSLLCLCIILFIIVGNEYKVYQEMSEQRPMSLVVEEYQKNPSYAPIEEINPIFLDAIVAVEDHRFYKRGAIDVVAILRATSKNVQEGKIVQGGSTITQQLAKNMFLTREQTMTRKIQEMFFAYELERTYTKDEILELYVNIIYYGDGHTGIKNASLGYFDKLPKDLSYEEATILAGLPQAPSLYALSQNYDLAIKRQEQVIEALSQFVGR